jgi:hypothetical protein
MFCFQRMGDQMWTSCDSVGRGFAQPRAARLNGEEFRVIKEMGVDPDKLPRASV